MSKSKNQLYRESGSKLPFKEWLRQDLNNEVSMALKETSFSNFSGTDAPLPYKPVLENSSFLGIPKNLIFGVVVITGCVLIYRSVRGAQTK